MLWADKRILTSHIEFIKPHIVQEHIDSAQIVSSDIDFLSVEAAAYGVFPQDFFRL